MIGSTARLGVLALALGALTLVPRASRAYEVKRSADGSLVRWEEARISFSVKPEVTEVPGAEKAIANAMAAWSGRGGAPEIVLGRKANAGASPGADGRNTIFYAKDGYGPAGNALAITILSFDEQTGRILDADIVLNGKFKLGRIGSGDDKDEYDVNRVVAHEMGHALGLSDEPAREDALMFPYVAPSSALRSAPAKDDVAGLSTLYEVPAGDARPDTAVGCGATVAGREGAPIPTSFVVAASFALGAALLARGGRRSKQLAAGSAVVAAVIFVAPPGAASPARGVYAHDSAAPAKAGDAIAVVTATRTSTVDGLLQTELELTTTSCTTVCPPTMRTTMWGGTADGIRQEIAGVAVPREGERVAVGLGRRASSRVFYQDGVSSAPDGVDVNTLERLAR